MTTQGRIAVIRGAIDGKAAARRVAALTASGAASIERRVHYPYFWYRASCAPRTLPGRRRFSPDCLVDAVGGRPTTADRFEVEHIADRDVTRLDARLDAAAAARVAAGFLRHRLARRLRTISDFGLELSDRGLVFKAYWVVRSGVVRVVVDSVTGGVYPLGAGDPTPPGRFTG